MAAGLAAITGRPVDLRIFIEPQQGALYDDQLRVARAAEAAGYDAFFRSDHFLAMGVSGEPGVLAGEKAQHFQQLTVPRLAAAGLVRFHALRIGEAIAAVYYGLLHDGHAYGYLTGLDPAFAHESPGTLVIAHAMEQAVREGAREFHFLRGGEAYKYGWGAVDRWNRRRVFRRRPADGT